MLPIQSLRSSTAMKRILGNETFSVLLAVCSVQENVNRDSISNSASKYLKGLFPEEVLIGSCCIFILGLFDADCTVEQLNLF